MIDMLSASGHSSTGRRVILYIDSNVKINPIIFEADIKEV